MMRKRLLATMIILAAIAISFYTAGCGGGGGSVEGVTGTTAGTTTGTAETYENPVPEDLTAWTTANMGNGGQQVTTFADGSSPSLASYLDMTTCNSSGCHNSIYSAYSETNHSGAWNKKAVQTSTSYANKSIFQYYKDSYGLKYCINCHTVNMPFKDADDDHAYDVGELTPFGVTPKTLTDYADYSAVPAEYQGIQCENCHGPASLHNSNNGTSSTLLSSSKIGNKKQAMRSTTCMYCHAQYDDWAKSQHAVADSTDATVKLQDNWAHPLSGFTNGKSSGNCGGCHTGDGFVKAISRNTEPKAFCTSDYKNRTDYVSADCATMNATTYAGNGHVGVTCATCHDPHNKGEGGAQLRVAEADLCTKCHNGRVRTYYQKSDGSTRYEKNPGGGRGIHLAAQAEMVSGGDYGAGGLIPTTGTPPAFSYGYSGTVATSTFTVKWKVLAKGSSMGATTCQDCHMYAKTDRAAGIEWTGHTFKVMTQACNTCHPSMNAASVIEAKQARFEEKFEAFEHKFAAFLNAKIATADTAGESGTCAEEVEGRCCNQMTTNSKERDYCAMIEFNFRLLETDHYSSKGVHNEPYVNSIYEESINMLKELGY